MNSTIVYMAGSYNSTDNVTLANATCSDTAVEKAKKIFIPVLFSLIFVLGALGNTCVLIYLARKKSLNTTDVFIGNLAISDSTFLLVCVPYMGVLQASQKWPFGEVFCKISNYVTFTTCWASAYTLVMLSIDRYIAISNPIWYRNTYKKTHALIACGLKWVVVLLVCIPVFFQFTVKTYIRCGEQRSACYDPIISQINLTRERQTKALPFYVTLVGLAYVVPLCLITIFNSLILWHLFFKLSPNLNNRTRSAHKEVAIMIIAVIIVFFILWLPMMGTFLFSVLTVPGRDSESWKKSTQEFYVAFLVIAQCMLYSNVCTNPIIYTFTSQRYRQHINELLCRYTRNGKSTNNKCTNNKYKFQEVKKCDTNPDDKTMTVL